MAISRYALYVTTVERTSNGSIRRQTPKFFLDANAQGIRDCADAESIARRIVNPLGLKSLEVYATAIAVATGVHHA